MLKITFLLSYVMLKLLIEMVLMGKKHCVKRSTNYLRLFNCTALSLHQHSSFLLAIYIYSEKNLRALFSASPQRKNKKEEKLLLDIHVSLVSGKN